MVLSSNNTTFVEITTITLASTDIFREMVGDVLYINTQKTCYLPNQYS